MRAEPKPILAVCHLYNAFSSPLTAEPEVFVGRRPCVVRASWKIANYRIQSICRNTLSFPLSLHAVCQGRPHRNREFVDSVTRRVKIEEDEARTLISIDLNQNHQSVES